MENPLEPRFGDFGRLVPSRYLSVSGVREDWGYVEACEDSWEGTKEKFFFVPSFSAHLRPRLPHVTVSARAQSCIRKIMNWEQSIHKLEDEHTMLLISVPSFLQKTAYRTQFRVKNIN